MRVEQVVGQRVRARRDELGMTQEDFGRKLGPLLGKPWSRQTVSAAEQGGRAWTAAELIAAAYVLDTRAAMFLAPPSDASNVEMPTGAALGIRDLIMTRMPEDLNLAAIQETLSLLAGGAVRSQEDAALVVKLVRDLDTQITQRLAAGGVVSLPSAGAGVEPVPRHSPEGDR